MTKLKIIVEALDDLKLTDILVYDMRERSPFFDYFIISTASNTRQLQASISHLKDALSKANMSLKNVEGAQSSGWVLVDAKDIIVNIFTEEDRAFYNIEKMWMDIDTIDISTL